MPLIEHGRLIIDQKQFSHKLTGGKSIFFELRVKTKVLYVCLYELSIPVPGVHLFDESLKSRLFHDCVWLEIGANHFADELIVLHLLSLLRTIRFSLGKRIFYCDGSSGFGARPWLSRLSLCGKNRKRSWKKYFSGQDVLITTHSKPSNIYTIWIVQSVTHISKNISQFGKKTFRQHISGNV